MLKNEGSYLGILWYLLNPLFMFAILFLIFSDRLGEGIPYYAVYLFLGIIMFNLFQQTTIEATRSIRENAGPIKAVNFPREAIPKSIVIKNLFSHFFEIILFLIVLLAFRVPVIRVLFYIPILLVFSIFIFGFSLILSCLRNYFLDLDGIWSFAVRLIWLGTPIFYAIGGQDKLFYVNLFNPVYYFISISRDIIIYAKVPGLWMIFGALCYTLIFLVFGLIIFNKLKPKFAELM